MEHKLTKLGKSNPEFDVFKLKSALTKNDAGDWGSDPIEGNATGILRSTNFTNQGILDLSDVAYRTLKPNKLAEKLLCAGEIIIERSGGSDSQPVGRIGFITPELADNNYAFANFIQRIAVDDTINPKYLYYCLQQMYEMGITASMQYQTTGIRNLDWKLYTKSILPKPKPDEQKAIATILSTVDEAIKATENSIKAAEKLKKSLMQNLLTGKLKPDGTWRKEDEGNKAILGNVKMRELQFFKNYFLPNGWKLVELNDIIDLKYGTNLTEGERNGGDVPVYGSNGIVGYHDKAIVKGPGIIIGRKGTAGAICWSENDYYPIDTTYYVSTKLQVNKKIDLRWVYYMLSILKMDKLNAATGVPGLNRRDALSLYTIMPEYDEQVSISNKLDAIGETILTKRVKISQLQRLKKSLMQNLLTGKVRVKIKQLQEQ